MTKADLILKMYRTDFLSFIGMAFKILHPGVAFDRNWHIDIVADQLDRLISGQITRLAINVPPRSLKSFLSSIALPAFLLGRNPTFQIILVAGSRQLGRDLIMKLQRLMSSDRYRAVFPHIDILVRATEIRLSHGGTIRLVIVGEQVSGRGADLVIIDDAISPSRATDDKARLAVNAWYDSEILPRLSNRTTGAILVVMHRVHPGDLCGHIMQNKHGFEVLSIPAIATRDEEWKFSSGGVHLRKKGEPINPRRESIDQLKSLLNQLGAFHFTGQYLQGQFHHWTEAESRTEFLMEEVPEGRSFKDGYSRRCGFFRIKTVSEILGQVFGVRFDGPKLVPFEHQPLEEWEAETMIQQAKLVSEVERSKIREMEK